MASSFLQFTASSCDKLYLLMVASKKCLNMSVVKMGSMSDFEMAFNVIF